MARSGSSATTRLTAIVMAVVVAAGALVAADSAGAATTERWDGADRYATSVRISQQAFPTGADVVFIATGQKFPDALAAGPAAATLNAPVLLTATDLLPTAVSTELQRLDPSVIYLLGGPAAITPGVQAEVDAATDADIQRIAGVDRYATAAAVTEMAFPNADVVYVAVGTGFADALSAGAPGGNYQRPVLLTGNSSLPQASRAQITRLANPDVIVLGGTAVVGNAVMAEIDALTTGSVRRVSGADRYATSVAVSVDAFDSADTVLLATGTAFPDALSAAPAATLVGAPILLTTPACAPAAVIAEVARLGANRVIVLGGTNAVSNAAANLTPCPVVVPPSPVERQQLKLNTLFAGLGTPPLEVDGISGPVTRQRLCAARLLLGMAVNTSNMAGGSSEEQRLLAATKFAVPNTSARFSPRWILIDKTCQMMFVGRGNSELTFVFPTSTGSRGFETRPQDRTRVFRYDPAADNGGWHNSTLYPVAIDNPLNGNMYKPLYFDGGQAIHGATNVPTSPQSKGCARLRVSHMNVLVNWLGLGNLRTPTWDKDRIGVTVNVQGTYRG